MVLQEGGDGFGGYPESLSLGIAVDAAGDERKGHGLTAVVRRQRQGAAVAGAQTLLLPVSAAVPDGAYGVDDVFRGQAVGAGDLRLPDPAAAQGPAFGQKLRSRGTVDGPVHAAAPQKRRVGRVDDGVYGHFRDIVANQ